MDDREYRDRVERIQLVRREISLAMPPPNFRGEAGYYHQAWHNFQPFLGDGDAYQWAFDIELGLIPALEESSDPDWHKLKFYLRLLVNELLGLEPFFEPDCPRCYG